MEQPFTQAHIAAPQVRRWLHFVALLVFCMVIVGGATRLTDSGLSITEWRPLLGAIPPLNEANWQALFEKYKLIPQFKIRNAGMSLDDFKFIFWWEWTHRLLGIFTGVSFVVPLLYFTLKHKIGPTLWPRLFALFVLGGAQGALGWYMVSSGLIDRVDVSQYRLAAHLTLAAFIFAAIVWIAKGVGRTRHYPASFDDCFAVVLIGLILLQIAAGGLVAGLDAGQGYTTWPKMDGQWIPEGLAAMAPGWRNVFENAMTVQFDHRLVAYFILLVAIIHAWRSFTLPAMILAYAVFTQACLGVLTLLLQVPLAVALVHQAGAMIVLTTAVWNLHTRLVIRSPVPDPQ